jgi:hypothetical protein
MVGTPVFSDRTEFSVTTAARGGFSHEKAAKIQAQCCRSRRTVHEREAFLQSFYSIHFFLGWLAELGSGLAYVHVPHRLMGNGATRGPGRAGRVDRGNRGCPCVSFTCVKHKRPPCQASCPIGGCLKVGEGKAESMLRGGATFSIFLSPAIQSRYSMARRLETLGSHARIEGQIWPT